jgi:hypothetical protein
LKARVVFWLLVSVGSIGALLFLLATLFFVFLPLIAWLVDTAGG